MDPADAEDRIARLELELQQLRARSTATPWAWWERHGRRVLFTFTLVALAAPTAVWMEARHEQHMLATAQRHEAKLVRHEGLAQRKQERVLSYIDTALNAEDPERRAAALRYLAQHAEKRSWGRWAKEELERTSAPTSTEPPPPRRRACRQD
jgi:hypothetical protein